MSGESTAHEVNQFDFQSVLIYQQVLQFYVLMEDATLTANVSSVNDLLHNLPCCPLIETSSLELHEPKHVHARQRALQDHGVVVRVVLPVQQYNYLRNAGALIGHECQADLHGEAFGMARLT